MTASPDAVTVMRGGRLLDVRVHRADPAHILVTGDTIATVGAPGLVAPRPPAAWTRARCCIRG